MSLCEVEDPTSRWSNRSIASYKRLPPSPVIVERNLAPPLARHVVFVQNQEEEVVVAGCEHGTSLQGVYWDRRGHRLVVKLSRLGHKELSRWLGLLWRKRGHSSRKDKYGDPGST